MFQVEPILFLQQFAGGGATFLMRAVTALGYPPFFFVALMVVLMGFDLRRGFAVAQIVIWTDIVTELAKAFFALPRPSDVDSAVRTLETGRPNPTPWAGHGAKQFLGLPDREAIAWLRAQPNPSFGLPSGHVSVSTALWGGLAAVYRSRAVLRFALLFVPLMALSRMVLGRHFLGDVLAGVVVGTLVVLIGAGLTVGERAPFSLIAAPSRGKLSSGRRAALVAFLVVPPLLIAVFGTPADAGRAGRLLGLDLAFLLVSVGGVPEADGRLGRRVARIAVGLAVGAALALVMGAVAELVSPGAPSRWVELGKGIVPTFALLWGGVALCRRVGLYEEPPHERAEARR